MQEGVFDQVAQLVQVFAIGPWRGCVFSGRDHHVHTLSASLLDDRRAVIAFISAQMFCREAFDQAARLCAICCGTLRNKDSDRHIMRIHGQMDLDVEPTLSGSCPSCRLWRPLNADALCNSWRQSSTIHSPAHQGRRSAIPPRPTLSRQRQNRRWTFFQSPRYCGKSRHGAPVRKIQKMALINNRLSLAIPLQTPSRPGKCAPNNFHVLSEMSCLLCDAFMLNLPRFSMILQQFSSRDDTTLVSPE